MRTTLVAAALVVAVVASPRAQGRRAVTFDDVLNVKAVGGATIYVMAADGGEASKWVITQTTRFKAAMVGAGLTNMWSMYDTNDIPSVLISYFGGIPNAKTLPLYLNRSAMSHIDKVTTPTLILHGAQDERVPVGQAQELFRGLKDRGKTTELVFYPREGHGISEYYHQKDRMQRIYDWVTKYTLVSAASRQPPAASGPNPTPDSRLPK